MKNAHHLGIVRGLACAVMLVVAATGASAQQATPTRTVALADGRMASTADSRQALKYLASCALDAGTTLMAEHGGEHFTFPGGIGLAPDWHARPMTDVEKRWVSACLLARTNRFGIRVEISLRSSFPSIAPGLQLAPNEAAAFPLEDAGFFGNLFAAQRVAFVCGPAHTQAQRASLVAQHRVCALPEADGITTCGMVHVGACTADALQQQGVAYQEVIRVFLPSQPSR